MAIKVATYNIHASVGRDGRFSPARIVDVINEIGADVVALQEVEHHRVGDLDMLDYIASETACEAIAGPTLLRQTRRYGNALLTKLPLLSLNRVDLSVHSYEPRGALDATFGCGGKTLRIVATHLGLKPHERRQQVRRLLALFDYGSADVSLLTGDLNEWFLWGRPLRWLYAHFHPTPHCATFPARWPLFALDRLWVSPCACLSELAVHRTPLSREASDHLPLTATIDIDQA